MPHQDFQYDHYYLDRLGTHEGSLIATQLYRENQQEFNSGRQLSPEEYKQILQWCIDRLLDEDKIPSKISTDRFHVFEQAFYLALRHKGLL